VGSIDLDEREFRRYEQTFPHLLENRSFSKSISLLDVGCGEGYWLSFLQNKTDFVLYGTDVSSIKILSAKKIVSDKNIRLSVSDITNLPFSDKEFDITTCLQVLEHIPEWKRGLSEILRVTSKRVIITVPYTQKLLSIICPRCHKDIYFYGHVNSFNEESFIKNIPSKEFDLSIKYLRDTVGLNHYIRNVLKKFLRNFSNKTDESTEIREGFLIVCPNCYSKIPAYKLFDRVIDRINRIIKRIPERMLILIDRK